MFINNIGENNHTLGMIRMMNKWHDLNLKRQDRIHVYPEVIIPSMARP